MTAIIKDRIWLSPPCMSGNEVKYIQEAIDGNWVAPVGPNVNAFEVELGKYLKCNVAALSSGTAALHLALILLSVKRGDIVLCQSLTFAASANPIVYQAATPVFIDSEKSTWNICPNALEDALKYYFRKGKRPKAVIGVHLYGMPCRMDEVLFLCNKYDVPFIEDAAEALGSTYKGKKLGTFGEMGILSFNGNKIITTSGGGALLSNQNEYIKKAKFLAAQARDEAAHYEHSEIGFNYGLSNISAGIGRAQLEMIDDRVKKRRSNFNHYFNKLKNFPGISFQNEPSKFSSNRWLTAIIVEPEISNGIGREDIRLNLAKENIESRPVWKPMHLQPVFSQAAYFGGKVSEQLFKKGLCLPSGSDLSDEGLKRICQNINQVLLQ